MGIATTGYHKYPFSKHDVRIIVGFSVWRRPTSSRRRLQLCFMDDIDKMVKVLQTKTLHKWVVNTYKRSEWHYNTGRVQVYSCDMQKLMS
jgi:hypothetical protein